MTRRLLRISPFTIITDDTTAAVAYMAGEVDFIMCPASQYLEISAQPELYGFCCAAHQAHCL